MRSDHLSPGAQRVLRLHDADGLGYPDAAYKAHDGAPVEVVAFQLGAPGAYGARDFYRVRAADGWTGVAFEDELAAA